MFHPEASYLPVITHLAKLESERMFADYQLSCLKKMEKFYLANYVTELYSFYVKLSCTTEENSFHQNDRKK